MARLTGHLIADDGLEWSASEVDGARSMMVGVVALLNDIEGAEQTLLQHDHVFDRDTFWDRHGVSTAIADQIIAWLGQNGLMVTQEGLVFWATGTVQQVGQALAIGFEGRKDGQRLLYRPAQEPRVPDILQDKIAGIVGLDNVASLAPQVKRPINREQVPNQGQGFAPRDIAGAYSFPTSWDGTGITIGLLEFSNGYSTYDIMTFWSAYNIPSPPVQFVSVDGTPNDHGVHSADMEATLDVEWAGALAPGAQLVVYEAAGGTSDASFGLSVLRALNYAVHDTTYHPTILSISYGDGESRFPHRVMRAWDTVMAHGTMIGITTFVASGDQGAYGLQSPGRLVPHVDAPANCPHAVAVGGTHLVLHADGTIAHETGWTDTNNNGASGGGISQIFGVPTYQTGVPLPVMPGFHTGRGVPDVAANADPDTGYAIVFQGSSTVVGGTSVASPVWAALTARLNQARTAAGKGPIGYFNPRIYSLGGTAVFHDITVGNNSYNGVAGYSCGPGWDAVTGWGSPDGTRLIGESS